MTTYHFSAHDHVLLPDLSESDHETVDDARREAVRIAYSLLGVTTVDPVQGIAITASDDAGATVFEMTLRFSGGR